MDTKVFTPTYHAQIVGLGKVIEKVDREGKAYSFRYVHALADSPYVDGKECISFRCYDFCDVFIGMECELSLLYVNYQLKQVRFV